MTVLSVIDEREGLKLYDLYFREVLDYTKLVPAEDRKNRAIACLQKQPLDEEVFVDAGGYTGDTVVDFDKNYRSYKKIISYEIMPSLCEKIRENTKGLHDIDVRNKGLAEKTESCM